MSKGHLRVKDAAKRLGHSTRWVRDRIGTEFVGYKHAPNDLTVSVESVEAYEDKVRIRIVGNKEAK